MIDIEKIEEVWRRYLEGWSDEVDQHNLSAWTGQTLEALFQEIRALRASLEAVLEEAISDLDRDIIITECQSVLRRQRHE